MSLPGASAPPLEDLPDARHSAPEAAAVMTIGRAMGRVVTSTVVAVVPVEARGRLVVAIEDEAEYLAALHDVERLTEQPARCAMRRYHEEKAVHPVGDDPAVLDGAERGRVHHDVVIAVARLIQEFAEPRGLEHLVW